MRADWGRVGPKLHRTGVFVRKETQRHTHTEKRPCEDGKIGVMYLQTKEHPRLPPVTRS